MAELTETVYEHISGADYFTTTCAERWSIAMAKKLKEKFPDEVDIRVVNKDGSMVVRFPFSWMRIVPKKRDTMSDERRAQLSEQMKQRNIKQ